MRWPAERDELRAVAVLAWGEDLGDRAAAAVGGQVDLDARPAAGMAQRPLIRRRPRDQFHGQRVPGASRVLVRADYGGVGADCPVFLFSLTAVGL